MLKVSIRSLTSLQILNETSYPLAKAKNFGNFSNYDCLQKKKLVLAKPFNACFDDLDNKHSIAGNIALAERGVCSFKRKAVVLHWAKAAAAVIINSDDLVFRMHSSEFGEPADLPVFMMSRSHGNSLLELIDFHSSLEAAETALESEIKLDHCENSNFKSNTYISSKFFFI